MLSGSNARFYQVLVYVYAGVLTALASFIMTARLNAAHPTIGVGLEFDAIAAVILGGTSFEKGRGGIVGTLIGALAVGVLRNGLNLMGVSTEWQVAIVGADHHRRGQPRFDPGAQLMSVGSRPRAGRSGLSCSGCRPTGCSSCCRGSWRLTALVVALSILSPHFLTWNNLVNVLRHAVPLFIMSAGLTLVVLTAGIDLSVGAVLGLAACLAASLIAGGHPVLGIAAALGAGLACGLVNGLLVSYARIPSFIATYGMLWIANGMAYVFMQGEVIYGLPASFRAIGTGMLGPIPVPILIMLGDAR